MSSKRPFNTLASSSTGEAPKRSSVVRASEACLTSASSVATSAGAVGVTPTRIDSINISADIDDGKTPPCTFQKLGEDAHCHILSYILCLPPAPMKPRESRSSLQHFRDEKYGNGDAGRKKLASDLYEEFFSLSSAEGAGYITVAANDKARYVRENEEYELRLSQMFNFPQRLADLCRELLTVSKHWCHVVRKLMNLKAPQDFLRPTALAVSKARVGRLDLSDVSRQFVSLCRDMWASRRFLPSDLYHDHDYRHHHHQHANVARNEHECPLGYIVRHYARNSYQLFAKLIENEYRKFLVVKCVEMVASTQKDEKYWAGPSMPGQIVHLYWMTHMARPRKYYQDCLSIAGNIIDCEHSSYQSVSPVTVSQYLTKRRTLFSFEHQLSSEYFFTGRQPALYSIENVVEVASMLRDEEAMREQRQLDGEELFTDTDIDANGVDGDELSRDSDAD